MTTKYLYDDKYIDVQWGPFLPTFLYTRYEQEVNDVKYKDKLTICLLFIKLYITLPWSTSYPYDDIKGFTKQYGFELRCNKHKFLFISWGTKSKTF